MKNTKAHKKVQNVDHDFRRLVISRIVELQEKQGWSHRELAARCTLTESYLWRILNFQINPGWDILGRIIQDGFGMNPEEFFEGVKFEGY